MLGLVPGEEYDVVIVGGDSAGCAIAGRLAARVFLLEAGASSWTPHLTTAHHLSGTAARGPVTDAALRVQGLRRLRVADLSVLPVAPRRGTAATAVALGEAASEFTAAEPPDGAG
jgi:choline dehydrogenase-like flavoprotein